MKNKTSQSGQSLVEAVVAIGIAILVLVTLVAGVTVSLRNIHFARNKANATKYAQEAEEALRSIRDREWDELSTGDHGLEWDGVAGQWILSGEDENIDRFTRVVTIADTVSPDLKQATIMVSWREGSQIKDVTVETMVAKIE